jgi:hypothetical protein
MESDNSTTEGARKPLSGKERQRNFRARKSAGKNRPLGVCGKPGTLIPQEAVFVIESIEKELKTGNIVTISYVQELVSFFFHIFLSLSCITSFSFFSHSSDIRSPTNSQNSKGIRKAIYKMDQKMDS